MRRLVAVLVALVTTIGTVPVVAVEPTASSDPYTDTVTNGDHEVPIRVNETEESETAPTLLWGHGWGGSYADADDDLHFYVENGYNVVAMDFRGHGQARATSEANVHALDKEIEDVRAVIDWIAGQDFAETDGPNDPVLGALGGSYGGGYQLLTASQDERLDAIAPEITWNSLPQSLAPNDAIKSTWVDLLYAAGTASANLAPFIHQGYAWGTATNEFPDGTLPGEPDVKGNFADSSPASYPDAIDVPTLLIQGMPDVLFPLNEAVANAGQIEDTTASPEVNLVTHLGGHVINTNGTLGDGEFDAGLQHPAGSSPCGDTDQLVLDWYDDHLKDDTDDGIERVELATESGNCLAGPAVAEAVLDEATTRTETVDTDVVLPQGAPVASGYAQAEEEARAPSPVQRTVLESGDTETVAGVPTLSGKLNVTGTQAIVYVSLVLDDADGERVVHDQVMPLRVDGPAEEETFELDLAGVAVDVAQGEALSLEFSTSHPMYGDNGNRQPGIVELGSMELTLPYVAS